MVTGGPEKKVSEQTRGVRRCKDLRPTFKKIQKFHLQTLKWWPKSVEKVEVQTTFYRDRLAVEKIIDKNDTRATADIKKSYIRVYLVAWR